MLGASVLAAPLLTIWVADPACAFEFFGLFGSDDKPPAVSPSTVPYALVFEAKSNGKTDDDAVQALRDASGTYKLRREAPPDGEGLVRRLQADAPPMLDALWALGYYNARIDVFVDGAVVSLDERGLADAAARAETYRNRKPVPVKIVAALGPVFKLRRLHVAYPRELAPDGLPHRAFRLLPGDSANSATLRAAQVRLVDWFRRRGRPLAKVADVKATVDHAALAMDLDIAVDAGPKAGIGAVTISGTKAIAPAAVASHVYLKRGEPYSPDRLAETKTSIARIQGVGGIRIREGDKLDADGNVPIFVDVSERARHVIGIAARYSTKDGPGVTTYWEDRNIFGGGERLRLEADAYLLQRIDGTSYNGFKGLKLADFGARLSASFIKPGLFGTPNDLLIDAMVNRQVVGNNSFGGYTSQAGGGTVGVIHRFSDVTSIQGGVQFERSYSQDVLGKVDATLVGATVGAHYDTTDSLLDPTRGVRAAATVNAYPEALGSSVGFVETHLSGSTYYALDEEAKYVLAGRVAAGSLDGAPLADIPSAHRFYSGGGGSVRGFTYGTISPLLYHQITGGRSLLEANLEARIKVTQTIGVVPFIDAGGAFRASIPNFKDYVGIGAGAGLRYLTPIGPIRLDVATPVNRRSGDGPVAAYVSIGQAF